MNVALKFAYNGKNFHGYARQPKLRTVEGELIKVLIKYDLIKDVKKSLFRSASRTDKGVSALCNVISFKTDNFDKLSLEDLSNEFEDIVIYGKKEVDSKFNPRHAKYRKYIYYLYSKNIDIDKIISSSEIFTGEHNFTNFARVEEHKNPVRAIDNIVFSKNDKFLIIDFYAQTFIWQQVRRIVSALEKIGLEKLDKKDVINALKNPNDRVDFGLASPDNLILADIVYDFEFEYDNYLLLKAL
jgi:tRNA pseudouridine38-40 synthase